MDGLEILEEVPGQLSLAVWQVYRDALEWVNSPADARSELFQAPLSQSAYLQQLVALSTSSQLSEALSTAWKVLGAGSGDSRARLSLTHALEKIASWAEAEGYDQTSAAFRGLAAGFRPRDADLAFRAGRAERRCGRFHQAEAWFQRSVGLARRSGDFAVYASAYLGWGLLAEERGRRDDARHLYTKALRAAKRGSLRGLMAAARHNLIPLCIPDRPFEEGHAHIVAAYRLYDPATAPLARLASDAGTFYGDHQYYQLALELLEAALPLIRRRAERTAVFSNIARAAAALGKRDLFSRAEQEVLSESVNPTEHTASALLELALAANTLGLHRKSRAWAAEAFRIASERGSESVEDAARRIIAELGEHRSTDTVKAAPPHLQRFVQRFVSRLRRHSPLA